MNAANVDINLRALGIPQALNQISQIERALGGLGRGAAGGISAAGVALGALTGNLLGQAAGAIASVGKNAVGLGFDFLGASEQAQVAFETMLGSASKAQDFYAQLQNFAATTPFELPGITQSAQKLLAFGFQAKDVIPDLTAIGNAVSATGGGQAALDRVVLALGQMRTKGKVQGDEMLQLTENNIAAWDYLARFLNTDVATAQKMVTKGLVSGQQGIDAILKGLATDPKFAGMMEKQSHTFLGLVSNMHDYWSRFVATIEQPVFDRVLKPGLEWLTGWLSGPGMALGTRLGQGLAAGLDRAGGALRWVLGEVRSFRAALGGDAVGGGPGAGLAAGFMQVRAVITDHVLPAVRLLWRTFFGGVTAGSVGDVIAQGLAGDVALFAKVGRGFQLLIDSVVTFKQALAGDWFKNGAGNDFVNTIGRIGLAWRDVGLAFQSGGLGAALGRLWTGYLQPALVNAWNGLTGWLGQLGGWITGTAAPAVGTWLLALALRFGTWVNESAIPYLQQNLPLWLAALGTWITGTAWPFVATSLQQLGQAFGTWVTDSAIPWLQTNLPKWIDALGVWADTVALPFVSTMLSWLGAAFGTWVTESAIPWLTRTLPGWIDALGRWFDATALPFVRTFLADVGKKFGEWVTNDAVPWLQKKLPEWITAFEAWVSGTVVPWALTALAGVGKNLAIGLANGMLDALPDWARDVLHIQKIATTGGALTGTGQGGAQTIGQTIGQAASVGDLTSPLTVGRTVGSTTTVTVPVTIQVNTPTTPEVVNELVRVAVPIIANGVYGALEGALGGPGGGGAPAGLMP